MTEERKKQLIGIANRIVDGLNEYNLFSTSMSEEKYGFKVYEEKSFLVSLGFMDMAEALGIEPTKGKATIIDGMVKKRYSIEYRGIRFYHFVDIMEVDEL